MAYKYTGRKGAGKPSKKRFGMEITDVKTAGLTPKHKKLVELTEKIQDTMRHPERHCVCLATGKQWYGCVGMEKGDPCPKMNMALKAIQKEIEEAKQMPDTTAQPEGGKHSQCTVSLPAVEMTPCKTDGKELKWASIDETHAVHPLAANTIQFIPFMKRKHDKL